MPVIFCPDSKDLSLRLPEAIAHTPLPTADATVFTLVSRAGEEELGKLASDASARARHLLHRSLPD